MFLVPAFLGGLALNIAPCILPVIAVKMASFARMSKEGGSAALHGLVYSLGIILSFVALGAIAALIKTGGGYVIFGSWALTSVWYNAFMALFLALLGAHQLWGKGKSALMGKLAPRWLKMLLDGIGDLLLSVRKYSSLIYSFVFGLLTTALGSACCGPVLGYAMGVALSLSAPSIMLAFLTAGLGMATPYLLLSLFPQWTKYLPKSGPWLGWVTKISGALMLLTAGWFAWLAL